MSKRMSDEAFDHLVRMNFGKAPRWCANAVATDHGWVNPRTGEILMASRGLATRINEFEAEKARREKLAAEAAKAEDKKPVSPVKVKDKVEVPVKEVAPVVEPVVEPEVEKVAEPEAEAPVEKKPKKTTAKKSSKKKAE